MVTKKSTKDALVETASRLFRLRGYDGIGLNDILKESSIPKGSMYHHFPGGKEELAVAAIQHTKNMAILDAQNILNQYDEYSTSEPIRLACEDTFNELESVYQEKLIQAGFQQERAGELSTLFNASIEGAIILSLAKKSKLPLQTIARQLPYILIRN
jgi:TetR/AcrR family transcriptional repressor of lmrAB and yxaGH operons